MTLEERLFAQVYRIRRVEERVSVEYPKDVIRSPVHLSIGQEAVAAGVCEALGKEDTIFGTYRSHATYIAKGGDLRKMVAELYGKDAGCCRGKGGSMHLIDPEVGALGGSAVVATTIPHAAGWAYANKMRG
ncbi:MAG: pyruvate dehydrogenase (acetyl-transferring) E1 component subunit alpha, partial [Verrucomicrobiaceae bacterium]|nr:pyruvate dehydrogenase (acetyl-transferring) E1 component subunit alpha [Verrucomicrobiaceae bacterium]